MPSRICLEGFFCHSDCIVLLQKTISMEKIINTAGDLEEQVNAIIGEYRQEAYTFVEEMMWNAFEAIGNLLAGMQDSNEYTYVMSRRFMNGISCSTLHEIVRAVEKGTGFENTENEKKAVYMTEFLKMRSLSFQATRAKYPNYLKPWTQEEDSELKRLWDGGVSLNRIAAQLGRNTGAVKIRMSKLGL